MRRARNLFLFGIAFFIFIPDAQAVRFTGNYLLGLCASDAKGNELVKGGHAACQSYISGILDYHSLMRSFGTAPSVDFCVPDTVTLEHLQNVVAKFIMRHRNQHGSFIASPAVALALFSAYPCGNN